MASPRSEISHPSSTKNLRIKVSEGWGVVRRKAEYEDLARIARENGLSIGEVREKVK